MAERSGKNPKRDGDPKKLLRADIPNPNKLVGEDIVSFARDFNQILPPNWRDLKTIGTELDRRGPLLTFHDALNSQPTEYTKQAVKILTDDLKKLEPTPALLGSDQFLEFWHKLDFALHMSLDYGKFEEGVTDEEKRYIQVAEQHYDKMLAAIVRMPLKDLPRIIQISELASAYLDPKGLTFLTKETINAVGDQVIPMGITEYKEFSKTIQDIEMPLLRKHVNKAEDVAKACIEALVNLDSQKWGWLQVNQIVDALSWMQNRPMKVIMTQYLLRYLWGSETSSESISFADPADFNFNKEGLAALLAHKLAQHELQTLIEHEKWQELYNHQLLKEINGSDITYKDVPAELTLLLYKAGLRAPKEVFEAQLDALTEVANSQKELTPSLVCVFAILVQSQQQYAEYVNQKLLEMKHLPDHFRQMLLDETPGIIYFTPQRKLRAVGPQGKLSSAFIIYTSTAEEAVVELQQSSPEQNYERPTRVDEKLKTADSIFAYDFVGDVAILPDEQVSKYLHNVNQQHVFDTDDNLAKITEFKKSLKEPNWNNTYVWLAALNSGDAALREAKKLGFEAVITTGNSVTFLIDKDIFYAQPDDKKLPIAITGALNEDGLVVFDVDEDLTYDNIGVAASRIVLDLMTRQEAPVTDEALTKKTVEEWNRNKRGSLPRIATDSKNLANVQVPLKVGETTVFATPA